MPTQFITIEKPSRWNASFDPEMSEADVDRILTVEPFRSMDPLAFPKSISLKNILRHDTRLRQFRANEIVIREGDYGHSAFFILSGTMEVILSPSLHPALLGRRVPQKKGLFRTIAQLWSNSNVRERFDIGAADNTPIEPNRVFLQDVPRVLKNSRTRILDPGECFGEIAALSRIPRTTTIISKDNAELIEIRWQGLRDLMRYDNALRDHVNRNYYNRALMTHLQAVPLFSHLPEAELERLMKATQFSTFGQYDWSGEYKRLATQSDPSSRSAQEPLIAQEGDYPNGIVLIRAGFARLSRKLGAGERTLDYLGAGRQYGLSEIVHNWRNPKANLPLQHSLRAVGYTHILTIPTSALEEIVLPTLPDKQFEALTLKVAPKTAQPDISTRLGVDLFEFLTDNRFFNGTATMVIDLDRCTRCDDCVRACAATHDNNPRFLRSGPAHEHVMIANACMHCVDPVCMLGCPTGAISRSSHGGQVAINPATCIGCKTCFNNCPYDAIRMVEARGEDGGILVDADMNPVLKATKCDLCIEQMASPACQKACPHGALARVNMNNLNSFASWLKK
jgi:Fe-S-cluster-containing dehydrogenase component/CRP-like cAMP-binding protein